MANYSLTPSSTSVTEGDSGYKTLTFTVTRSGYLPSETLDYNTWKGTATSADGDYKAEIDTPLSFSSGQTSKTFSIRVYGDTKVESNEQFQVSIEKGNTELDRSTVTINNDDANTTNYSLTPSSTSVTEGDSGYKTLTFTVTRSGYLPSETLDYNTWKGTATSADGDYKAEIDTPLSFSSGQTSKTFSIRVYGDTKVESNEQFQVSIEKGNTELDRSTVTINNDDANTTNYSLTPSSTSVTEGDSGYKTLTFTVTRSGYLPSETLDYNTWKGTATSADGDYKAEIDTPLSFSSGQTSKTFSIRVYGDTKVESNEQFQVSIEKGNTELDRSTVTINNDDANTTNYSLTPSSTSVTEGDSGYKTLTFTVTRSGYLPSETLDYNTWKGTATSADGDYKAEIDTPLSFSSGQTSKTFSIRVYGDTKVESNEQFQVSIEKGNTELDRSTVTINNDDANTTNYSLTPSSTSVTEGDSGYKTLTFTVTRSGYLPSETLDYNTWKGTATSADGDYKAEIDTPLSFSSGQTSKTFSIRVYGDTKVESNEQFQVSIEKGNTELDRSTVTINNDDSNSDDYADDPSETGTTNGVGSVSVSGSVSGTIGAPDADDNQYGDKDVFTVSLQAGRTYNFNVDGSDGLNDAIFTLRDSNFDSVLGYSNQGDPASLSYEIDKSGMYFVRVGTGSVGQQGDYTLSVTDNGSSISDDYADDPSETGTTNGVGSVSVSGSVSGTIGAPDADDNQYGDKDVFTVSLQAGRTYNFNVDGSDGLNDAIFTLRDSNFDSVLGYSNQGNPSSLTYDIETTGEYYVQVGTGSIGQQGNYTLSIDEVDAVVVPPAGSRTDINSSIIVEMANLAAAAYSPTDYFSGAGWVPVSGPGFSTINSNDPSNNWAIPDVNLHLYETYVEGVRTLAMAFSGTAKPLPDLITQVGQWDALYEDFSARISAALNWAENQQPASAEPFGKLLVTGHSLGGVLVEEFLADVDLHSSSELVRNASAITFGSPGSPKEVIDDQKLVQFVNLGDFVAMLHSDDFFDFKARVEDEATLQKAAIDLALLVEGTSIEGAASLLANETGQLPSRDGKTITMVSTENTIIDLYNSKAAHSMSGGGGYLDTVSQLSEVFDKNGSGIFADLQSWEASSGGWHFIKPEEELTSQDFTVAVYSGLGFTAANYALSAPRLIIGGFNSYINVSTSITETIIDGVTKAVNVIGNKIEGTVEALDSIFESFLDYAEVKYKGTFFDSDDADFSDGSVIIGIDLDRDGTSDLQSHFLGEYDLSRFFIVPDDDGTKIVYSKYAQLQASNRSDILIGLGGNEVISAFSGDDYVIGQAGSDTIFGDNGDDTLIGGQDADQLHGGSGNDTASYVSASTGLSAYLLRSNFNTGDAAGDTYISIENLIGSNYDDYLTGNAFANRVDGGPGDDVISGDSGHDELYGGQDNDWLIGDEGNDLLDGGDGLDGIVFVSADSGVVVDISRSFASVGDDTDTLNNVEAALGSYHNDTLIGDNGRNWFWGRDGRDHLDGGPGRDFLDGEDGADFMSGGTGNDTYVVDNTGDIVSEAGGNGIDSVNSSVGFALPAGLENLTLTGAGNIGGTGNALNNAITGNGGKNTLKGLNGNDTMKGGNGNDKLYGGKHNDKLYGGKHNDKLYGGKHNDLLKGDDHNDQLYGGSHNDKLYGGKGKDTLQGDAGNDKIIGGSGTDTAVYSGKINDYKIVKAGSKIKVIDKDGKFGTDIVSSVEKLKFGGKTYKVKDALKKANDTQQKKVVASDEDILGDPPGDDEIALIQLADLLFNMSMLASDDLLV